MEIQWGWVEITRILLFNYLQLWRRIPGGRSVLLYVGWNYLRLEMN